jgi:hypothetical protein
MSIWIARAWPSSGSLADHVRAIAAQRTVARRDDEPVCDVDPP